MGVLLVADEALVGVALDLIADYGPARPSQVVVSSPRRCIMNQIRLERVLYVGGTILAWAIVLSPFVYATLSLARLI